MPAAAFFFIVSGYFSAWVSLEVELHTRTETTKEGAFGWRLRCGPAENVRQNRVEIWRKK
jgi:hypothetical protein